MKKPTTVGKSQHAHEGDEGPTGRMDVDAGFHSRAFLHAENGYQNDAIILERVLGKAEKKRRGFSPLHQKIYLLCVLPQILDNGFQVIRILFRVVLGYHVFQFRNGKFQAIRARSPAFAKLVSGVGCE